MELRRPSAVRGGCVGVLRAGWYGQLHAEHQRSYGDRGSGPRVESPITAA